MTQFLIRTGQAGGAWRLLEPGKAENPIDTLKLVTESPEFVGLLTPELGVPRVAVAVPKTGSGRVALAVDEQGRVLLVACPRKLEEQELAGLVADVLATGGRFWHQPYDVLAAPFKDALGKPLEALLADRSGEGWSAEEFHTAAAASLNRGRFPVVVVAAEATKPVQDMLDYLRNMNLKVTLLGYEYLAGEGVEFVRPRLLAGGAVEVKPEPPPVEVPKPVGTSAPAPPKGPKKKEKAPAVHRPEYDAFQPEPAATSAVQSGVVVTLAGLEKLGLERHGMEFFVPQAGGRKAAEATIIIATDQGRWPAPEKDQVIVVVNPGEEHMGGFLKLGSDEVETFLASLPRVERPEPRGCILLRAANVTEATQLVSELKALKEVATLGY